MTDSKFSNSFSEETWYQKYKFGSDTCVEDTWRRVAKDLASIEKDKEKWEEEFYSILDDFKFVPGGRITSNAGTKLKGTTFFNCFVSGAEGYDIDSIEGIYKELTRQAKILKSEGGYGFCADFMRPSGSHIKGIANQSPGAVKFLELWDKSSEIITSGSGKKSRKDQKNFIRKGAQMVTLSSSHPDIIEFIEAKKTEGRLTKFNMSVLCTDKFMKAVEKDEPWDLVFPNYEEYSALYKSSWDGNFNKWEEIIRQAGGKAPVFIIYHTFDSARELWDLIMSNTSSRNEPGCIFIDTVNYMNNLKKIEYISASNPCGEQYLAINSACLLGSINLVKFINEDYNDWDYDKLHNVIRVAVRLMDNVNDVSNLPLKEQDKEVKAKRRIGLGVMGYASALMMMRVRYSSKRGLDLTDKLMRFITNTAYSESAILAKEKGAFDKYDDSDFLSSNFVKKLDDSTKKLIKKYGIRNSHLTSIQPTGNSACFANLVSGGLEPLFMHGYVRTSIQPSPPDGMWMPVDIVWNKKSFFTTAPDNWDGDEKTSTQWKWVKEGDEHLLSTEFNDKVWKYDKNRGLLKEEWIEDYAVTNLKAREKWNPDAKWSDCSMDLKVEEHIKVMEVFANMIDSAMSKTVSVSNDYPYEDFKDVYIKAWKAGIKGVTTYREGTMATVLSATSSLDSTEGKIIKTSSPERPKDLNCDVHHIKVKGEEYFVLVGLLEGDPYEVFAGKNGFIDKKTKKGSVRKLGRPKGVYKAVLEDGLELSPVNATCSQDEDALTRMTSTALRHGADIHMIVQQLEKVKGDMHTFAKSMARALKKYIKDGTKEGYNCPDCGQDSLIRMEGCLKCLGCSYSACS